MTLLLGLTGSIGMGKTTTAQMFRDLGVPVWDADATVHKLYEPGGAAVPEIQRVLPDAIVEGRVSRDALKTAIQASSDVIKMLEAIVHPLVAHDRAQFIKDNATAEIIMFDIPLLYETGADAWLDKVVVVTAPEHIQRARVLERGSMTETQLDMIIARQMPDIQKRERADWVIETITLDATRRAVQNLIGKLRGDLDHA